MKASFNRFLAVAGLLPVFSYSALATDITKSDNTTLLDLGGSWSGTAPGANDVATWAGAYATAGSLSAAFSANTAVSWQGVKIGSISGTAAGLVSIGGTGNAVTGSQVTIGSSGIDMSAANQNLVINAATTVLTGSTQTWNVTTGRNLRFGTTGTGAANANLDGTAGTVITLQGGGVIDANQGGGSGFGDATGFAGFNGKWVIGSGTTLRGIRNGSTAWGSNTSADAITLNGGTLAVGGISGTQGNWTWNSKMTLADAAASSIDNQLFSGTNRWLKLEGAISGGSLNTGTLTFKNTNSAVMNNDEYGFIISGASTFTGGMTISANTYVRIGGSAAGTADQNAGNNGSLAGSLAIINNGVFRLTRNDAWTLANNISGSGQLKIGGTLGTTTSQNVTVSGTNTFSGATSVVNGRMNLSGSLTSAVSVASAAKISGTGSTTGLLTMAAGSSIVLAGGATTASLTVNGVTFSGATTVTFDSPGSASTNYDVLSYGSGSVTNPGNLSVAWRGTLTNDTANKKFVFATGSTAARTWSAASGTWDVYSSANFAEGDNKFISGDTVTFNEPASTSTVTLSGRLAPTSVTVNNSSNGYTFSGADGTADITGSGSLSKSGAGTLTITSAQTYTGATSVNAGTLKFTGTGSVGSTSGISLASGAVFEWGRDAAVNRDFSGSGTITRSTTTGNAVFSGNNTAFTGSWNITSGYVGLANDGTVGASGVGMTWNGGGIFFNGTGNTLSSSRTITLGASGGTLNGSTGNTNTFAAKFTGTGNLNKVSGEKAILTAVNDFTGNISISGGGTLEIGGAGQFGNGSYAGAVSITSGNTFSINTSADQTLSGVVSGGGSLNKGSSGALVLTTANTYTGTTTIGGGRLALGTGASLYGTGGFFGTAATTNVFINSGGTLETRDWSYGAGNAFNEMRANSYAIRINGGSVRFTENTSAVRGFQVGANGATLEADTGVAYTKLAGDVSSDNIIQGVSGGSLTLTGAGNGVIEDGIGSYGTWSGSAGITKSGAGTWILSGINTYSGVTAVNGGTLRINGTNSGSGAVNVSSGATLGGTGSIAGAVNVSGILAPGASIESLGTGNLAFSTGSTLAYELNSTSQNGDLLDSSGTLDIASGTTLTLTDLAAGTLANGAKLTLISYFGGWVNTELFTYLGSTLADDSVITLGSNQWLFNYNDISGGSNFAADQTGATSFVTMTVVPEPAAALLGGVGFLILLRRRRNGALS